MVYEFNIPWYRLLNICLCVWRYVSHATICQARFAFWRMENSVLLFRACSVRDKSQRVKCSARVPRVSTKLGKRRELWNRMDFTGWQNFKKLKNFGLKRRQYCKKTNINCHTDAWKIVYMLQPTKYEVINAWYSVKYFLAKVVLSKTVF